MNPVQWMYETIEECCARHYFWDIIGCMSSDSSYVDPTEDLFYPDWLGSCIADGNAPAYMKKHYSTWMYGEYGRSLLLAIPNFITSSCSHENVDYTFSTASLKDCCTRYYSWSDGYSNCLSAGGVDPTYPASSEGWCK